MFDSIKVMGTKFVLNMYPGKIAQMKITQPCDEINIKPIYILS